jgi:hypothetical protein
LEGMMPIHYGNEPIVKAKKLLMKFHQKPRIRWDRAMREWQLYDGEKLLAWGDLPEMVRLAHTREVTLTSY